MGRLELERRDQQILDRADPRTLATWEQYERFQRAEFEQRIREFVARVGS